MSELIHILAQDNAPLHESVVRYFGTRAVKAKNLTVLMASLASKQSNTVILFPRYNASKTGIASGYAATSQLRAAGYDKLRIIILSNELGIGEREKAKYAGADEVLVVPFDPNALEALL